MQTFKVGDKIRVRQWDDMAKEYGTSTDATGKEHICYPSSFVQGMKYLCGRTGTITSIDQSCEDIQWLQIEWDKSMKEYWVIDNGSVELIQSDEACKGNKDISIGDTVYIIDDEYIYRSYADWVIAYAPEFAAYYAFSHLPDSKNDFAFTVVAIAPHEQSFFGILYLIRSQCTGACYLIHEKGIEKKDNTAEADSKKIDIAEGACVCITDSSKVYPKFSQWIKDNAPKYAEQFAYGQIPKEGTHCYVVAKTKPTLTGLYGRLYLLRDRDTNACYIVREKGFAGVVDMTADYDNNSKICVGDMVEVVDNQKTYPNYSDWVLFHAPEYAHRVVYKKEPVNQNTYEVVAKAPHGVRNAMVYLIKSAHSDKCYLIDEKGIRKLKVRI